MDCVALTVGTAALTGDEKATIDVMVNEKSSEVVVSEGSSSSMDLNWRANASGPNWANTNRAMVSAATTGITSALWVVVMPMRMFAPSRNATTYFCKGSFQKQTMAAMIISCRVICASEELSGRAWKSRPLVAHSINPVLIVIVHAAAALDFVHRAP